MKAARAAGAVASGGVGGGERERRELSAMDGPRVSILWRKPWLRGLRKTEREREKASRCLMTNVAPAQRAG